MVDLRITALHFLIRVGANEPVLCVLWLTEDATALRSQALIETRLATVIASDQVVDDSRPDHRTLGIARSDDTAEDRLLNIV